MIENYINSYARRYGKFIESDVVEENEMLKGDFAEVDGAGNLLKMELLRRMFHFILKLPKMKTKKSF